MAQQNATYNISVTSIILPKLSVPGTISNTLYNDESGKLMFEDFQLNQLEYENRDLTINRYSSSNRKNDNALILGRSKSDTVGTQKRVVKGDELGAIKFRGSDNLAFRDAAKIIAIADNNWDYTSQQNISGSLVFKTYSKSNEIEAMRISSAGVVSIGCGARDGNLSIKFTSDYHSAGFVPIWATGPGADIFDNFMDNTDIGRILIEYVKTR